MWSITTRFDAESREIADRHYNRRKVGSPQFVPPGRCLVLKRSGALWVTSWPFAEFVRHAWAGAWVNSLFRRESGPLASELIRAAVAMTLARWPDHPRIASARGEISMVTFVDRGKVREKADGKTYGRCYLRAGFVEIGETKGGLLALGFPVESLNALRSQEAA